MSRELRHDHPSASVAHLEPSVIGTLERSSMIGMLERWMFALAERRAVRVGAVALALAVLLGLGVLGLGHPPGDANIDTRYFYLAGKYWHAGMNAYAPEAPPPDVGPLGDAFAEYNFAYAPQIAALCLLVGFGTLAQACAAMAALNLLAVALLAWVGVLTVEEPGVLTVEEPGAPPPPASTAQRWFVPALIAGNLATAFVVWTGQSTLIVTAALAATWYLAQRDRWALAGIALAVATMKPTLSLFVVLWLVLERRWRLLFTAGAVALVFAAPAIVAAGPLRLIPDWWAAMASYPNHWYNVVGSRMLFNLRSLLHAAGIEVPDLFVVGALVMAALWIARGRFADRDVLPLLVGTALLFGVAHGYDVAALVVLIPAFWRHLHRRPVAGLAALALLVAISFPNSALERFDSALLMHARVAFAAGALVWLAALGAAEATDARSRARQTGAASVGRCLPSTSRIP